MTIKTATFTIASGASVSESKFLSGSLVRVFIPSGWATANELTFTSAIDADATPVADYDKDGALVTLAATAGRCVRPTVADYAVGGYMQIQRRTSGTLETSGGAQTITVQYREFA